MDSWSFICYCGCSITNFNGTIMKNPIAKYLMCSYAYYKEDNPLISDDEFDSLAKWLLENWNAIDHPHKKYITKSDLEAGTYLGKYPSMIPGAVKSYRKINSL
jgi:hypothetical protein